MRMFFIVLFMSGTALLPAQSAETIIDSARNRIGAVTTASRSRMALADRKGQPGERIIGQFLK